MKDWVWIVAGCIATAIGVPLILATCDMLTGCASPQPAVDVAAYEAEQLQCVEEAGTRHDADVCRNTVRAKYGREAGAIQPVILIVDAGGQ